jgi:hypothetical protein
VGRDGGDLFEHLGWGQAAPDRAVAYISALLTALWSEQVDWESLLPDVWIAAHPEYFLTHRRDEAEAAAIARRRRRERRRAKAPEHCRSP